MFIDIYAKTYNVQLLIIYIILIKCLRKIEISQIFKLTLKEARFQRTKMKLNRI